MSGMGHEQTSRHVHAMSVIPLKADIHQRGLHVCFVPEADIAASWIRSARLRVPCVSSDPSEIQLLGGAYYPDGLTKTPRTFDYRGGGHLSS
jgi:hypothetical protein